MHRYLLIAALAVGCSHAPETAKRHAATAPVDHAKLVSATDRAEADRALDAGRKPAEFLQFIGVAPGMKVGELMVGGGYTTELLARAVGPSGKVYAENPAGVLKFAGTMWEARLAKPVMANVVRVDRELDDPFGPEVKDLDVVVSNAIYHDTTWLGVDRAKMNAAVASALRPGGAYVVCDSSAKPGTGLQDTQTLHRIDEQVVRDEVTAAGFRFERSGDFLRNPQDARDWNASPSAAAEKRGTSDRFCLRFVK